METRAYFKEFAVRNLILFVFLPMHGLGLAGMPRRIPDFPTAWVGWNGVICAGVILSVMGGVLFFVQFDSQRHRNGRGLPHLGPAPCAAGVLA